VAWSGTADSVTSDIISAWEAEGTNPTLIANATYENTPANLNVTTDWATYTVSAPIDTASTNNVIVFIWSDVTDTTAGDFLYLAGVQLEAGSVATPFERIDYGRQLIQCQRYFYRMNTSGLFDSYALGFASTTTSAVMHVTLKVTMRSSPTVTSSTLQLDDVGSGFAVTGLTVNFPSTDLAKLTATVASGLTAFRPYQLTANNSTNAFVAFSSEL
jgi:hypothetical protein